MAPRFCPEVEALLRRAGWCEGRRFDIDVYRTFSMQPLPSALPILIEFGGLLIPASGAGVDFARSDVDLRPLWTDMTFKGYPKFEQRIDSKLYPFGSARWGHEDLLVDEQSRIYGVFEELRFVAPTFDEALDYLLLGKRGPLRLLSD